MSSLMKILLVAMMCLAMEDVSMAAHGHTQSYSQSDGDDSHSSSSSSYHQMMVDVSINYVRNTLPSSTNDTAGKVSIGGMFNSWLGLDLQGLYGLKSNNYLVGTDFRIVPVEWLFMKGGIGGYDDKSTNTFKSTPLFGAGIMARIDRNYYFTTEASYFQVTQQNNVSFGVGVGLFF